MLNSSFLRVLNGNEELLKDRRKIDKLKKLKINNYNVEELVELITLYLKYDNHNEAKILTNKCIEKKIYEGIDCMLKKYLVTENSEMFTEWLEIAVLHHKVSMFHQIAEMYVEKEIDKAYQLATFGYKYNNIKCGYVIGLYHEHNLDTANAWKIYDKIKNVEPRAYLRLGKIHHLKMAEPKNHEKAKDIELRFYQKALEKKCMEAHYYIAVYYKKQNNNQGFEEHIRESITLTKSSSSYLLYANYLKIKGENAECILMHERNALLNNNPVSIFKLYEYYKDHDKEKSETYLMSALFQDYPLANIEYGNRKMEEGCYEEALKYCEKIPMNVEEINQIILSYIICLFKMNNGEKINMIIHMSIRKMTNISSGNMIELLSFLAKNMDEYYYYPNLYLCVRYYRDMRSAELLGDFFFGKKKYLAIEYYTYFLKLGGNGDKLKKCFNTAIEYYKYLTSKIPLNNINICTEKAKMLGDENVRKYITKRRINHFCSKCFCYTKVFDDNGQNICDECFI